MAEIIRGKFAHFRQPPAGPERQAKLEQAHAAQLNERMAMWLVDAERNVGLSVTRSFLLSALGWVDDRRMFKGGRK